MTQLTEAQMKKGRDLFLASNPAALRKVDALTQAEAEAEAMFTSLDKLREAETMKEIARYAHQEGRAPQELFFSLVSETAEEFAQLCEARNAAMKTALGL